MIFDAKIVQIAENHEKLNSFFGHLPRAGRQNRVQNRDFSEIHDFFTFFSIKFLIKNFLKYVKQAAFLLVALIKKEHF